MLRNINENTICTIRYTVYITQYNVLRSDFCFNNVKYDAAVFRICNKRN